MMSYSLLVIILASFALFSTSSRASSFTPSPSSSGRMLVPRHGKKLVAPSSFIHQMAGGSSIDDEEAQVRGGGLSSPPPAPTTTPGTSGFLGPNAKTPAGWLRTKFPSWPWDRLPDYLTYMRCIAIPLLVAGFYSPDRHVFVGVLFALASFTDWLDGFLARRWDISTAFGAFLDPVADKIMVCTALVLLSGRYGAQVAVPTCIILARELAVSALREWMAQRGQRDAVKVGYQGKVKTALTMLALTLLLFVPESGGDNWMLSLYLPGLASLYVCALITVTSGSVYFRAAAPLLLEKK